MPEIAEQLRSAREGAGLDIATVEADTKIRGKYLRALESGEWDLLPEPTSTKAFLRTYADYLGLDGRAMVENFKLRYEYTGDLPAPTSANPVQPRSRRLLNRGAIAVVLVSLVIVGLFLIGRSSGASPAVLLPALLPPA
ncbi:MAG: helix-turn-helix domain-containing protein [Solirubrobacterales bacterium]